MSYPDYAWLGEKALKLLKNAAGTVLVSHSKLRDGEDLTMHLRKLGSTTQSRCNKVKAGIIMHIKHAEKIAVTCDDCFR